MRVVAIIQARMGSTRLPGKVLMDITGQTMLARVVARTKKVPSVDEVVVATTDGPADDVIVAECERLGVPAFRGDEHDVLDRYYWAARTYQAEAVVRITSDCPLLDPAVSDKVVRAFLAVEPDYASNWLSRTYPRGLETEVMTLRALESAWSEAAEPYERAHVTPHLYRNPSRFALLSVTNHEDYSGCRWTVDTPEDLLFATAVYRRLAKDGFFQWTSVLELLRREPSLADLNRDVRQKALHEG